MAEILSGYVDHFKGVDYLNNDNSLSQFALQHDLQISKGFVQHRRKTGVRIGGAITFKDKENRRLFVRNDWTKWEEKKSFELTIGDFYRGTNGRPFWAKTFSERDIASDHVGDHVTVRFDDKIRGTNFLSYEKELINGAGTRFAVVRFLNDNAKPRRVTVVRGDVTGCYFFRREDWVSKGQWKVSEYGYSEGENMFKDLSLPGDKTDDLLDFIKGVKIC
jgi:hypothetical protein